MQAYAPLVKAAREYASNPAPFLYAVFLRFIFSAMAFFSGLAFLFAALFAFSLVKIPSPYGLLAFALIALFSTVFSTYFWASFKGSMINSFMSAEQGEVHMRSFLQYAFRNGMRFFGIFLVKNFILILVNIPAILLFAFAGISISSLPGVLIILASLLLTIAARFAFSLSYVSSAVKGLPSLSAIRGNFRFILKNTLGSITLYIFHELTVILLLIPLANVLALISIYPLLYTLTVDYYKSKF